MLNHAFLIIAHDSPELLKRVIDNLRAPNHYFFIHLDKKTDIQLFNSMGGGVNYIDRISVNHGCFSQLMVEPMLLKSALDYPVKIDYFHLISGHDYPCQSVQKFDSFFEDNNGKSFMHFDTEQQHEAWRPRITKRYSQWNITDLRLNKLVFKLSNKLLNRYFVKHVPMELYAGWNWFSWHRKVAEFVMKEIDNHPTYLESFRYSYCCDEVIFHTLLYKHINELNIDKDNALRYIDWFPKREYTSLPLVLDERDYDDIKASKAFFCRKVFLGKSDKLLTLLDKDINSEL